MATIRLRKWSTIAFDDWIQIVRNVPADTVFVIQEENKTVTAGSLVKWLDSQLIDDESYVSFTDAELAEIEANTAAANTAKRIRKSRKG